MRPLGGRDIDQHALGAGKVDPLEQRRGDGLFGGDGHDRRRRPTAEPIIAIPISPMTVRTSSKSTLTRPGKLMISAMPPTALRHVVRGNGRSSSIETSSPSTSISLSLRMTISESTCFCSSARPVSATFMRLPSKPNGLVTTATVRMPIFARHFSDDRRRTGTVPPPMPAVMKAMWAPFSASAMRSRSSTAATRPASGRRRHRGRSCRAAA